MDYASRAREVLLVEQEELGRVCESVGAEFNAAVKLILGRLSVGGKIVVCGVGKSYLVGEKISATLASTGSTSVALHPSQAAHGDLGVLRDGDVLLAVSFSGESPELLAIVPVVKRQGVKIVAMTGPGPNSLAACSDVVIPVPVRREACPFNMAPTATTTATLALGDALAVVLLEARGFTREDYARLHPGGAIGSSLLLKVSDIMRKGSRLPVVGPGASVKDAILAMAGAKSGCVAVTDQGGTLEGIFTDGDLRRLIAASAGSIPDRPVAEVMTRSPVTVHDTALAVEVLRVFEAHNIDDLLVVDASGRLVGLVDIQDLPKFKIL